jgi:hypothetical protein
LSSRLSLLRCRHSQCVTAVAVAAVAAVVVLVTAAITVAVVVAAATTIAATAAAVVTATAINLGYLATAVGDNEVGDGKNEGKLLAISIAMAMQRYDVGCITQ